MKTFMVMDNEAGEFIVIVYSKKYRKIAILNEN